jgi:hypothetical protein
MTIVLTVFTDMAPVPRVQVDLLPADLLATTTTITVRATANGRQFDVRGAVLIPATTAEVVFDYEPTFDGLNVYEAACYNASGVYLGVIPLGSVLVPFDGTVVQQPLDPRLGVSVIPLAGSAKDLQRPTTGEPVWPDNARFPVIVSSGPRRGLVDVPLVLSTLTLADADVLQSTLGDYDRDLPAVWLVRSSTLVRLPPKLFARVAGFTETDFDVALDGETLTFTATLTEIEPPLVGTAPAVLRYADVGAVYSTYSGLGAVYTKYSDIKRDQSLVGAAG